jgi:hypothetical protein
MMARLHDRFSFLLAFVRAARRHGTAASDLIAGPEALRCPRAMAAGRLAVRAMAAGACPGCAWPPDDAAVDAELARMGASAEESRGCGCDDCRACHPAGQAGRPALAGGRGSLLE